MKFLFSAVVLCALGCMASAQFAGRDFRGQYRPQQFDQYYNNRFFRNQYNDPRYYNGRNLNAPNARIISQHYEPSAQPNGVFGYNFQTENGIASTVQGSPIQQVTRNGARQKIEGAYSYTTPEGVRVGVQYIADENGFRPILSYGGANPALARAEPSAHVRINKGN